MQPQDSPIPPSMIPTSATTRLSRSSTSSSRRYYSRSSFGSSSTNTSGRSRSISATYQRADKALANKVPFAKRASTGSHLSLLRKAVGRSTVPTVDDGYTADFEEHSAFDAVDTLKMRFNRSPKTPSTLRALRIMEQRTGTSNTTSTDNGYPAAAKSEDNRKETIASVEDWSDDYDIPETAECIVRFESPKHIPAFPSNHALVSTNIDTTVEEAMRAGLKYEPLVAPVDAISNITDKFLSQGGFTRCLSTQGVSEDHAQDDSIDIEEMMAEHADFANATQLLNKTDNLDFSTTSFQVWRDVPSSLSIDSFSNSLILAPTAKIDNTLQTSFLRAPLQPKTLVRRTPSKLRHEIAVISPEETIEVDVPEIVLQDATERSVDPDAFPGHIFDTYPSGAPTLPIWVDSVSFYTALEGPSEGDLFDLDKRRLAEETLGHHPSDDTSTAGSLANHIHPIPISPDLLPVSDSNLKSCSDSLNLDGSSPKLQDVRSAEHATTSASNSFHMSQFTSSLPHHQLEATHMTSPIVCSESVSLSWGAGRVDTSPAQSIPAFVFPARLPGLQQGLKGESVDVGVGTQLGESEYSHSVAVHREPTASAPWFQRSELVTAGVGLGMSIPPSPLAICDFPTIESLDSLPDFYEFSNSVPVVVLEQPPRKQPLLRNEDNVELLDGLDPEDALLRSLPAPFPKLSAEEARDWGRTVEVCVVTPSSTIIVDTRHDVASIVTPSPAPSVMDETPPVDGEIFAVENVGGLRNTREREEEDFILPAPLPVNDVSKSGTFFREELSPGLRDFVQGATEVQNDHAESPLLVRHQDSLPLSMSVERGVVGFNNIMLDSSTLPAEHPLPYHSSPSVVSVPHIDSVALAAQAPLYISASPRSAVLDAITTGATNMAEVGSVIQRQVYKENQLRDNTTRAGGHTRRRMSAIERWRHACAKAEVLSLSVGVDSPPLPYPIQGFPNLYRSLSSPPYTQQYSSAIAMLRQPPVSRTQSLVPGQSTYLDQHRRKTKGCSYKRRSKRTRSSLKASCLSKASLIPTVLMGNTSDIASMEKTGANVVASLSSTALGAPRSCTVVEFDNPTGIADGAIDLLAGQGQRNADDYSRVIPTPPQSPASRHNLDVTTSEGWESGGMSFWGSPRKRKRNKLLHLFKRPGLLEGYVAASTTPSSGPVDPTNSDSPRVRHSKSRRWWFNMNHHDRPLRPPQVMSDPFAPNSAVTLAPWKSPNQQGHSSNWISRSRAAVSGPPTSNVATVWPGNSIPPPLSKPKGGRLEAVVHKLQSLL